MVRIYGYDSNYEGGEKPVEIIETKKLNSALVSSIMKDFSRYGTQVFEFCFVNENGLTPLATFTILHINGKTVKIWKDCRLNVNF